MIEWVKSVINLLVGINVLCAFNELTNIRYRIFEMLIFKTENYFYSGLFHFNEKQNCLKLSGCKIAKSVLVSKIDQLMCKVIICAI